MSECYIIAAKLHLSKKEFLDWLSSKSPSSDSIEDWEEMYQGWSSSGAKAELSFEGGDGTVAEYLSRVIEYASDGASYVSLMKYNEEQAAFHLYVMSIMGHDSETAERLICTLRSASRFKTSTVPDVVLYWPEMSGEVSFPGMMSVAHIGNGKSEFVDKLKFKKLRLTQKQIKKDYKDLELWYDEYLDEMLENGDDCSGKPTTWKLEKYVDANFLSIIG